MLEHGGQAALKAILEHGNFPVAYRDIPDETRAAIERDIEWGSPREGVLKLERYVATLARPQIRQTHAAAFRKARRAHGVKRHAPRWQRGGHRPRSIEAAMQDPRIRGQLS